MKLQFFLDKFKNDLNVLETKNGKVNKTDVDTVVKRWEKAFINENTLTKYEQEFQNILELDRKLSMEEFDEGVRLLMLIHLPLIDGRNDVSGVRLRDADYFRLSNKLLGRDLEDGLDEYKEEVQELAKKRKREKERKQEQRERQQRQRK